jgi:polyhydroxyalkanoate synthesis regulator phasin
MVEELKNAMTKAGKLPENEQKRIAELILDEIEWDSAFQSSPEKLSTLAKEALADYKTGKTKPMDL